MDVKGFGGWIVANGGVVSPTTSQWEVIRYKHPEFGVCVVYQNAKGAIRHTGATSSHYDLFCNGKPLVIHKRPSHSSVTRSLRDDVAGRDGEWCWFCSVGGAEVKLTLEHLLAISAGGSNHMSNLALACDPCNTQVGSLPVVEKVRWRDRAQASYMKGLDIHENQSAADYLPWSAHNSAISNLRQQDNSSAP